MSREGFRLKTVLLGTLASFLFVHSAAFAGPLTFRWTSVAGFTLDDGETTLAFDPVFTRPGILNWLGLKELPPDFEAIEENLKALEIKKIDAVFSSHEHFDHVIDAPAIARKFGATLYGGPSLERVVKANSARFGWPELKYKSVADRETITVGKFRIKFYWREHAAIFPKIGFHFLPGPVTDDFHFGFYQYREGDVLCWLIEHPEGRIFVDQGSHLFEGVVPDLKEPGKKLDAMFLGVSNKKSVADFVEKYVAGFKPSLVIPLHFDFFFVAPDREHTKMLPGIEYESIVREAEKVSPGTRFQMPKYGQRIPLRSPYP